MNFRTLRYYLTVCEMGTINAAAKKLYISQQSLSQQMKKLETELEVQLFHRDNPISLTPAGRSLEAAARQIFATLDTLEQELAAQKGTVAVELTIGMLDHGTPDFFPALLERFLQLEPNVLLNTRELFHYDMLPEDIPLFFSSRPLGSSYRSELLLSDQLVVAVADELLEVTYGDGWRDVQQRLYEGDITALKGCPFVRSKNTPLEALADELFSSYDFVPYYLAIMGNTSLTASLCKGKRAATISFLGYCNSDPDFPPCYPISHAMERIPSAYVCYPAHRRLSSTAQRFLEITRKYFHRTVQENCPNSNG